MRNILLPLQAIACGVLIGCVEPAEISGAEAYAENCAQCHGAGARGDGELAPVLSVAPPDLTMLAARNGGAFPRDDVMSTIDGYRRGEHFAPEMPAFGEGDLGPTVIVETAEGVGTPIPVVLIALADYLESVQVAGR